MIRGFYILTLFVVASILVSKPAFAALTKKIIVNVPIHTPADSSIFLTGDIPGYCSWQPNCLKMAKIDGQDRTFVTTIRLPRSYHSLAIKVTRGSWDSEAAALDGSAQANTALDLYNNDEVVHNIVNWKDIGLTNDGRFERFDNFYSDQLDNHRTIIVWLPKAYDRQPEKHFPVIYMHDGENVFNTGTSMFGKSWLVENAMSILIKENRIAPAIVVGIFSAGWERRFSEYEMIHGKGALYGKFLVERVLPFIERRYRAISERRGKFLMGSSMGALISFSLLWAYPKVFAKAACLSFPAFIHKRSSFKVLQYFTPPQQASLYLDYGTWGGDQGYGPTVRDFYDQVSILQPLTKLLAFSYADHSEIDWSRRLDHPLEFLIGRHQF